MDIRTKWGWWAGTVLAGATVLAAGLLVLAAVLAGAAAVRAAWGWLWH